MRVKVYCDTDKCVYRVASTEVDADGLDVPKFEYEWINPSSAMARIGDLEAKVAQLEGQPS